jgi:excisionase family DNA binding protein
MGQSRPRDLLTASQVARFCQVDLKTIHNWAERGEISHFRTPGRHLRFRRPDVLDFLQRFGYPIPEELASARPRVLIVDTDAEHAERARAMLEPLFDVFVSADPVSALVTVGAARPSVLVLGELGPLDPSETLTALKDHPVTRHTPVVLIDRPSSNGNAHPTVARNDLPGLQKALTELLSSPPS